MLAIQEKSITNTTNRPYLRDKNKYFIRELKGIIAHWTANKGSNADAEAHYKYFNRVPTFTSAHYFIDDHQIIQIIPSHEVAYHIGGKTYKPIGIEFIGDSLLTPNYFAIGFEMCVNSEGDWAKTYQHSVELAAYLLHKYQFGTDKLYRHYDITGKGCPGMMLTNANWNAFKNAVAIALKKLLPTPLRLSRVTADLLNVRKSPNSNATKVDALPKGTKIIVYAEDGSWLSIGQDRWVHGAYVELVAEKQDAQVSATTGANIRSGAGQQFEVVEVFPKGAYVSLLGQEGDWHQIGENLWLHKTVVKAVDRRRFATVINASFLNVRTGPSGKNPRVRQLKAGEVVQIFEESSGWTRIGLDEWVYNRYLKENS